MATTLSAPATSPATAPDTLRDRLVVIIERVTGWLDALDDALPADDTVARTVWDAPAVGAVEDKVVAECATLLHVAARVPDAPVTRAVARLRAAVALRARPARHLGLLWQAPHVVWPVGLVHEVLTAQGVPDPSYDAAVRAALAHGGNDAVDRQVFRSLEMSWIASIRTGAAPAVPSARPWGQLPAFLARRDEGYALTHAVLYATDFGRCPGGSPVEDSRIIDAYLADRIWADDLDLVGELALTALAARLPCRHLPAALHVLIGSMRDGVAPGPSASHGAPVAPGEEFARCYHTTLVVGLTLAAALAASYTPPEGPRDPDRVASGVSAVLARTATELDLHAVWVRLVDDAPADPAELVALAREGALCAAVRRRDAATAAELADELAAAGPGSLLVRQARRLLRTQEVIAHAITAGPGALG